MMKVMKVTTEMPSPGPAGNDGPQLNSRSSTSNPVMWMGIRSTMAMMSMRMMREKRRKAMMH
jgi:hypothetical protein